VDVRKSGYGVGDDLVLVRLRKTAVRKDMEAHHRITITNQVS
jgi:hypothetical protein